MTNEIPNGFFQNRISKAMAAIMPPSQNHLLCLSIFLLDFDHQRQHHGKDHHDPDYAEKQLLPAEFSLLGRGSRCLRLV
jgi:hypothetical protein